MIRIALPDPLVWQAGIEFGLQGIADAFSRGEFSCILNSEGPMLEAVAYAIKEMNIGNVEYADSRLIRKKGAEVFLFPRVQKMDVGSIRYLVDSGQTVITSDPAVTKFAPNILLFMRRDVVRLSSTLQAHFDAITSTV
jgi:hypothetical protein